MAREQVALDGVDVYIMDWARCGSQSLRAEIRRPDDAVGAWVIHDARIAALQLWYQVCSVMIRTPLV